MLPDDEMKKLIKSLKLNGTKYDGVQESKSLLAVFEQQLFIWHHSGSCILTVELGEIDINTIEEYHVLLPTNPPVFEVDCLSFNRIGTLLALVGYKGVIVLQVPWMSRISTSKGPIFCRSWHIAERFFTCMNRVNILQASWHPGSLNCTHIVILSSDNYLRLYDATDSQTPLQAIQLGSTAAQLPSQLKISFAASFGEGAVSFDFGPPEYEPVTNISTAITTLGTEEEDYLYPIYVLHSNGDVYLLRMPLKKNNLSKVKVQGPLVMQPSAEDNYGVDACSLICLHSNPPLLVIAMASGTIYHCLILDADSLDEENQLNSTWMLTVNNEPETALYVHGSVELPISLSGDFTDSDNQPIRLYKDITCNSKYYCSLVSGVHAVVTPIVQRLGEVRNEESIDNLRYQLQENDSYVEHILCTKPLSAVKEVPVIGLAFAVMDKGITLICLLASWEFTCLHLLSSFQPLANPLLSTDPSQNESTKDLAENGFSQQIQQLCNHSASMPIIKSHANTEDQLISESRQFVELLWNTTAMLRESYIERFTLMHKHIKHRSSILICHKTQQMQELELHLKQKDKLREKAEQLAEKYEDTHANQQLLFERIEKVMKILQQRFPVLSNAEVDMKRDLLDMEDKIKTFQSSLDQLKKKLNNHKEKLKKDDSKSDLQDLKTKMEIMNLGETQLKHVKEILHQEGESISKLVKTVFSLKRDV